MSAVGGVTPCPECVPCQACGGVAWCLSEPGSYPPCPHDEQLCGDCMLGEDGCTACQQDVEAALRRAFDTFDGDPFRRPGDDPDPLGPLAAEDRARVERFWSTVGDRPRLGGEASHG